jgi:hypothetical protein
VPIDQTRCASGFVDIYPVTPQLVHEPGALAVRARPKGLGRNHRAVSSRISLLAQTARMAMRSRKI